MVSWGWRSDTPNPSHFVDEHEWAGTRDIAAYLTTPAAIDFMVEHDWDTVRADCHALAAEARRQLSVLTALPPLHDETAFAQMFSAPLPHCDITALKTRLSDERRVEAPIIRWNDRTLIRVSAQGYVTPPTLSNCSRHSRRLLPVTRKEYS